MLSPSHENIVDIRNDDYGDKRKSFNKATFVSNHDREIGSVSSMEKIVTQKPGTSLGYIKPLDMRNRPKTSNFREKSVGKIRVKSGIVTKN